MIVIKRYFSKLRQQDKSKLIQILEGEITPLQIKSYLLKNIIDNNWYLCDKISTYTYLFKYYRSFWDDIIPQLRQRINNTKQFSIKQLYYLSSFMKSISYQPDNNTDASFIQKIKNSLDKPNSMFLMANLRINKNDLSQKLPQIQSQLLSLNQHLQGITFRQILINGCFMQYWSPQFRQTIATSQKYSISQRLKRMVSTPIPSLDRSQKVNIDPHRSKVQMIFEEYLIEMGYIFQHNIFIGHYEIDFLINNKIIIQFNGHHHYCSNNFKLLNSRNRYKQAALQKSGYIVINIDIEQWRGVIRTGNRNNLDRKFKFISNIIEKAYLQYLRTESQNK